jgi:hypothetical protein
MLVFIFVRANESNGVLTFPRFIEFAITISFRIMVLITQFLIASTIPQYWHNWTGVNYAGTNRTYLEGYDLSKKRQHCCHLRHCLVLCCGGVRVVAVAVN